jgi:hypothetical protein
MRNSVFILVIAAFTMVALCMTINAFAVCSTCTQEGDWTKSADSFIAGTPVSEDPAAYGPKVVRQKSSQFENVDAGKYKTSDNASGASDSTASASKASIDLINISATPMPVDSGTEVKINAVLRENNADTSSAGNGSMITALATIQDSTGKEVGKATLLQTNEHEYSGVWKANVAAGEYKVSVTASSLQATGKFEDALNIEVVEAAASNSGTAQSSAPAVKDLG